MRFSFFSKRGLRSVISILFADLLRGHIVCGCPHVNLLINVKTRDDEEYSGAPGTALYLVVKRLKRFFYNIDILSRLYEPAQPEDDGSLVLLVTILLLH